MLRKLTEVAKLFNMDGPKTMNQDTVLEKAEYEETGDG